MNKYINYSMYKEQYSNRNYTLNLFLYILSFNWWKNCFHNSISYSYIKPSDKRGYVFRGCGFIKNTNCYKKQHLQMIKDHSHLWDKNSREKQ